MTQAAPASPRELALLAALRKAVASRKADWDASTAVESALAPDDGSELSPLQEERIDRAIDNLAAAVPDDAVEASVTLANVRELMNWVN